MPSFVHTIRLYDRNIRVKCKELDFLSYKNLTKTIYTNDSEAINSYIDQVLQDLVVNADISKLDIIDKFIILGHIREVGISSEFQLSAVCEKTEKEYTIKIDLQKVLEQLNKVNLEKSYQSKAAGITVNFQLPNSFNATTLSDVVAACIHSVVNKNGDEIKITDYADRSQILEKLPVTVLSDFQKFLKREDEKLNKLSIFKYRSPHSDDSPINTYKFSFFDTSMTELLKLLFQEDLLQMYEFEYDMYTVCKVPYEVVKNSSFSELQVLYNIEARRQKETQEQPGTPEGAFPTPGPAGPPPNYDQQ